MATHRRTWQKAEERAAALFGAMRAVLSGSSGRSDAGASDATHPTLFIESKLREKHAARTLHDATRALARKEGKVPVLALFDKSRPGFLVVIHSDDLAAVVAEYCGANPSDELEGAIRRAFLRLRGELPGEDAAYEAPAAAHFDPARWLVLPGGFGGIPRDAMGPCECGALFFDLVLVERESGLDASGRPTRRQLLSVQCPRCPLRSARRGDVHRVIGKLDVTRQSLVDLEPGWETDVA